MFNPWKVSWLCALLFVSSTLGRSITPKKAGEKPDPRDLWGLVNVWEGDDLGHLPSGLCSHLAGNSYPDPNLIIPNQFGGYPGPGTIGGGHLPPPSTGYFPPAPGHGYTSGVHQANAYGGFSGAAVTPPGGSYPPYLPPTPGHGYTAGGHQANNYGGFNGVPVSVPLGSIPSNQGYTPPAGHGVPVSAPPGFAPQSQGYVPPNSGHGYTAGIHEANAYGGFAGLPGNGLTGTTFVNPAIRGPGQAGYVVSGAGGSYNNAQSNSEHTAFEQNKEHASQSSGAQGNYYGANVGGVTYPSSEIVAAQGNQFATSGFNKESTKFEQNKESNSASSGQQENYYGAANNGYVPQGYGGSQIVAGQGSQFQTANHNKESSMSQSQKESNSASSGSSGQYYGATDVGYGGRPSYVGASQVVAVDGSQFQTANSNKESSMSQSQKESNSASSGSSGQYYGAANVADCGGRPCPVPRPYGASQVVAVDGSQFQTANSNKESSMSQSQKEANSASSGSTGQYYGAANVADCGGRPCPVPRPYGASQVVAVDGSQFQTANSNKESSMSQSQKESNSASSGSSGQYYGATDVGYSGRPSYVGASQVVAVDGSQFANSASNKESIKSESQKESNSASSGSTGQYYGAVDTGFSGRPGYVGASQVVAVDGSQFSNSASNKESSKTESQKESNSASSGSTGQYYGTENTGFSGRPSYVGASQVVAVDGSQFSNSASNKESSKTESQKESNSASSGSTGQYYGAANTGFSGRPSYVGASQVVAVDGSQFSNSAANKESSKTESQKESNSASSGSTGQYYGAANTGFSGRPGYVGASQVVAVDGSQFSNSASNKESTKSESQKESSSASSGQTGQYYGVENTGFSGRPAYVGASQVVAVDGSQFSNSASNKESSKTESQKESNSASSGSSGEYYGAAGYTGGRPGYVGASQVVSGQGEQFQTSNSNSESIKQEHNKESNSASSGQTGQFYGESGIGVGIVDRRPYGASQIVAADSAQFQNSDSSKESSKFEQNKASASTSSGQQEGYYAASNSPYGVGGSQVVSAGQGSQFQTSNSDSESTKQEMSKESVSSSSGSQGQFAAASQGAYVPNRGQIVSLEAGQGAQFQNSESSKESSKLEHSAEQSSASSQAQFDANFGGFNRPGGVGNQFVAGTGTTFETSSHDKELTKFDAEKSHSSSSSGSAASHAATVSLDRPEAFALVAAGSEFNPVAVRPPGRRDFVRYDCSGCKTAY